MSSTSSYICCRVISMRARLSPAGWRIPVNFLRYADSPEDRNRSYRILNGFATAQNNRPGNYGASNGSLDMSQSLPVDLVLPRTEGDSFSSIYFKHKSVTNRIAKPLKIRLGIYGIDASGHYRGPGASTLRLAHYMHVESLTHQEPPVFATRIPTVTAHCYSYYINAAYVSLTMSHIPAPYLLLVQGQQLVGQLPANSTDQRGRIGLLDNHV
nr:hypothetical protein CFP56_63062 [Quercus suber]